MLLSLALGAGLAALSMRPRTAPTTVPEIARASGPGRPVIFVGLDGADWEFVDRLIAGGAMPNLAALVRDGNGGTLLSLHPPLSPLVWTTMMTGVSPLDHGILDFTRVNPATGREEPITSAERRVPAVWNMASYAGKRVAVFGLWATYPAETVNGVLVSDRLFPFLFTQESDSTGMVRPAGEWPRVRRMRREAEDSVGLPEMKAYLPWLDEAQLRSVPDSADPYAHPVTALRRILVETRLMHRLATDRLRHERPDLTIVYFQGTDSIGHVFGPYAPPRQPSVPEGEFERFQRVPERYFRYVDGLLGEYRQLAERAGAVFVMASDHGFRWFEGRPAQLASAGHATAAAWHRPEGMFLVWGPGIAPSAGHTHRGRVRQVAATLLALLDLPPRAPGDSPLPGVAVNGRPPADYTAHYRPATPVQSGSGAASEEALEKLRALGYVGAARSSSSGAEGAARPSRSVGSYVNESLILRLEGRRAEAMAAAERALELDSNQATALWVLSDLLKAEPGALDRSEALLLQALAAGLPEGPRYLAGRAERYRRAGKGERARRLLDAAVKARPAEPETWRVRGQQRLDAGNCAAARADFVQAVSLAPEDRASHANLGLALLCLGKQAEASEALARADAGLGQAHEALARSALARGDLSRAEREARLAMAESEAPLPATLLLAEVLLRRSRPEEALRTLAEAAQASSGPVQNLALLRGDALARLGRADDAEAALRKEIRLFPGNAVAYSRLAFVLALQGRPAKEVGDLLESMYAASPQPETAALAARTAASLGDRETARRFEERGAAPDAELR